MKKLSLLLVIFTVTILAFTGCKDDSIDLPGTTWEATIMLGTQSTVQQIYFNDSKNVTITSIYNGTVEDTVTGTYTYAHPKVTITADGETGDLTVTSSTTMTLTKVEGGVSVTLTYKKK